MASNGQFLFDHVPFGEYQVLANGPSGAVRSILKVDAALEQPVVLSFAPLLSISGRAVFEGDRAMPAAAELAKFQVRLIPVPQLSGSSLVSAPIRPDGSFSLRVARGRYQLVVVPLPPWNHTASRLAGLTTRQPIEVTADVTDAEVVLVSWSLPPRPTF